MTVAKREFNPTHFNPNHAAEYARLVAKGHECTVESGGLFFQPSTDSIKGSAIDLSQTPAVKAFGDWKLVHDTQIDIRWFGAKLDGVTDDWPVVKSAFEYAKFIGGGIVTVPAGVKMAVDISSNSDRITPPDNSGLDMNGSELVLLDTIGRTAFICDRDVDGFFFSNFVLNDPNNRVGVNSLVEIDNQGGIVKNIAMDNIEWNGENTTVSYTGALMRIRSAFKNVQMDGCTLNKCGYGVRTFPRTALGVDIPIGNCDQFTFTNNTSTEASRQMFFLSGNVSRVKVDRNTFDKYQENEVPKHPFQFDAANSAFYNPQITNNMIKGREDLVADVGHANGAIGDAISCKSFHGGFVGFNEVEDGNEFGITLVNGCFDVKVAFNKLNKINSVGIAVGASTNETVRGNIITNNIVHKAGINASGHLTDDYDGAAIRLHNSDKALVESNVISDSRTGISYRTSTRNYAGNNSIAGSMFYDTYVSADASFVPESPFLPSLELPYGVSISGNGEDFIEGGTVQGLAGTETSFEAYATIAISATRTSEVRVLGAASNRLRLNINPDNTLALRIHTANGFEDHTTTDTIPAGAKKFSVCISFDGTSLSGRYSLENVNSAGEVESWNDMDAITFAATTVSSNFAAGLRPAIGSQNGVATTDITEPFKILSTVGFADGAKIWDFQPRTLRIATEKRFMDIYGTQWAQIGIAPVAVALDTL